jgi:SAM-dependent methyltransferase
MERSQLPEIMDDPDCPEALVEAGYRDMMRVHRWLGNLRAVVRLIANDPRPVRRILDVGCGRGAVMTEVARRLGVEAVGVDLRPFPGILQLDAARDPLPEADVAISLLLAHHLSENEVVRVIENVLRSSRRFIVLDLVRHPIPLWLFRIFLAPVLAPVVAYDGALSVRRAYTGAELNALARSAGAPFRHHVAPFYIRQVIDIGGPDVHWFGSGRRR